MKTEDTGGRDFLKIEELLRLVTKKKIVEEDEENEEVDELDLALQKDKQVYSSLKETMRNLLVPFESLK